MRHVVESGSLTRRGALLLAAAGGAALAGARSAGAKVPGTSSPASQTRPPPTARKFVSPGVEAIIAQTLPRIGDPRLALLFAACWPNTLDTAVELGEIDGREDAFILTGDIPALWLRDSSAQLWSYLPAASSDPDLRRLFRGLIRRQVRCIMIDPYANAFLRDPKGRAPLPWAVKDETVMAPGVAERKWEIDSLCHPIRLAHGYWRATGDAAPFDGEWRDAMAQVVATFRQQQRLEDLGPYSFLRLTETPNDTLAGFGFGAPTRKVGLIHSMFRPSDDACVLPFHIPGNLFAVASLRRLAEMVRAIHRDEAFADRCLALAAQVEAALRDHGLIERGGRRVWAYEVDGFGNALFVDDANIPGLISLPYLGSVERTDALWRDTRAEVLSDDNPYFYRGSAAEGLGGPHVGPRMIWPMGLCMRAITSDDDTEIARCLTWLKRSAVGAGLMHESFDQDDPTRFTRPWFAWANGLFGELILDLARRKPALLA